MVIARSLGGALGPIDVGQAAAQIPAKLARIRPGCTRWVRGRGVMSTLPRGAGPGSVCSPFAL